MQFSDAAGPRAEPEPEFHMVLPDASIYKDLHGEMQALVPPVNEARIRTFYDTCGKTWEEKYVSMYNERYCRFIRIAESSTSSYVRSEVWAEMKKTVSYTVDLILGASGVIEETQCECGVGQGPSAHCKHVGTVLFGLSAFKLTGNLCTEQTCTQILQTFHKSKPHRGSPVKSGDFAKHRKAAASNLVYDPRPVHRRQNPGKIDNLRSRIINRRDGVRRPFMNMFPPANINAFALDHQYKSLSMEDHFLEKNCITRIDAKAIREIEESTRQQAQSPRWFDEKQKRMTASKFGEICKATERKDLDALAKSIIFPASLKRAKACLHGIRYESVAIEEFERQCASVVEKSGLWVLAEHPMIAASPDGIIDEETIVEVKCPLVAFRKPINPGTVPYLKDVKGNLSLCVKHQYYHQVQGQMMCSGRKLCKFIVFTEMDMKVIDIPLNENFVDEMKKKLLTFFNVHFKPALLRYLFYKETGDYSFD